MTTEEHDLIRRALDLEAKVAERDATISLQADKLVVLQGTLAELRRAFVDQVGLLTGEQVANAKLRARVAQLEDLLREACDGPEMMTKEWVKRTRAALKTKPEGT